MAHGREGTSERSRWVCVLGAVALVLVALASLLAGTAALGTREALQALATLASGGTADATATLVLLSVRLPRVLAGVCCGAALACSGLLLQASLDNDLASPVCFVNLSFHKTASVRFTRQREDSSRTSVALAPILSSPTTPRA